MATAKKEEKFQPHDYATYLLSSKKWRSDRNMLFKWVETHWSVINKQEDSEADAYAWLVAKKPSHISPENAKRAVKAACLHLPALDDVALTSVIVPCKNGYVHMPAVGTGAPVLLPANPDLNVRHSLAVSYDASAPSAPLFEKFIRRALPDDDVRGRVQEYIGYTLLPDARHQKAQLWLGEGANGKGVLANVVQKLHGIVAAVQLQRLDGFNLEAIVGSSLIYVDEVPRGKFDEQMVKSLIAGERVPVTRKWQSTISLRLHGKWIVCGNHIPTVTDHSVGFWRRWDLVPFGETIPERERDPLLLDKILFGEMPAVLNWALAGLQRLLDRGGFKPELPHPMADLLHGARTDSNSIQAWMQDVRICLAPGGATPTRKTSIYTHYRDWCIANGLQAFSSTKWLQFLETQYQNRIIQKRQRGKGDKNPDWYINIVFEESLEFASLDLEFCNA